MTEQVYNSTSLTLTNLTRGENYSFAVAVTDSTGQHGAWSEELNVAWNGMQAITQATEVISFLHACMGFKMSHVHVVCSTQLTAKGD